jgi:hypothetical protein
VQRGGRKKGTLNKKTLLKLAAIKAAASDPDKSPLDVFLGLMRDGNLPLELRITIAQEALPFMHARPKELTPPRRNRQTHRRAAEGYNHQDAHEDAVMGVRVRVIPGAPKSSADDQGTTPLGFLLHLMRAPTTPPHLLIRVASIVAPYVHARSTRPVPTEATVEDQYGFSIDLEAAKQFRGDRARLDARKRPKPEQCDQAMEATGAEIALLKERVDDAIDRFGCPAGYDGADADDDQERVVALAEKRKTEALTPEEDAEEALIMARVAAYLASPKGRRRTDVPRLRTLAHRRNIREIALSAEDEREYVDLSARYPDCGPKPPPGPPLPPMPDRSWLTLPRPEAQPRK